MQGQHGVDPQSASPMIAILCAIFGGFILLIERDDRDQMGIGTAPWTGLLIVTAAALLWLQKLTFVDWAICFGLTGYILTAPHNWCLSPPSQIMSKPRDPIQWVLAFVFRSKDGQILGWGAWLSFATVRYAAPAVAIGLLSGNIAMIAVGPLLAGCYFPASYWFAKGEVTKLFGAVFVGSLFYGALGFGIR